MVMTNYHGVLDLSTDDKSLSFVIEAVSEMEVQGTERRKSPLVTEGVSKLKTPA